ncbi:MAG: cupin domain-containing protein [Cyanobacteria bacterium]|nr:cupin domain-containing protein [Cyanobacteriota bacterium]
MNTNLWKCLTSCAVVGVTIAVGAAQSSPVTRTELQRSDLSIPGREAVMIVAEIPAGVSSDRHRHPGENLGYILEGTIVLRVDGRTPQTLTTGDVFVIAPGVVHNARNVGSTRARVLDTYIIEKGKAVTTRDPDPRQRRQHRR